MTFNKIPVRGLFRFGSLLYLRLDASKAKNMLAVCLETGVIEKFDASDRVRREDGYLLLSTFPAKKRSRTEIKWRVATLRIDGLVGITLKRIIP